MSTTEINVKSTKNEILDAYHEVLQQLKEAKKVNKQDLKHEQEKQVIIEEAASHTTDGIVKNLADLKLSLVKSLEMLEHQLLNEHKKLVVLQQAIAVQRNELEALYEIKINTDTLAALLEAQKQQKDAFDKDIALRRQQFEEEITGKRLYWKQEQEATEAFRKEQEGEQKS